MDIRQNPNDPRAVAIRTGKGGVLAWFYYHQNHGGGFVEEGSNLDIESWEQADAEALDIRVDPDNEGAVVVRAGENVTAGTHLYFDGNGGGYTDQDVSEWPLAELAPEEP